VLFKEPNSILIITNDDNVININKINAPARRRMKGEHRMVNLTASCAKLYQGRIERTKPCPSTLLQTIEGPISLQTRRESPEAVKPRG